MDNGHLFELDTAIGINQWLVASGRTDLMAVLTGKNSNLPDIAFYPCPRVGLPDFSNPFARLKGESSHAVLAEVQDTIGRLAVRVDEVCDTFVEVKLRDTVQMGTPRYNFVNGAWRVNRHGSGVDLLAGALNSPKFKAETRDFVSQFEGGYRDLRSYVLDGNCPQLTVPPSVLSAALGNGGRYIVGRSEIGTDLAACLIESYYTTGKLRPAQYMVIGGCGVYAMSSADPLGLAAPRLVDSVDRTRSATLAVRVFMRSRGCYEIVPELRFRTHAVVPSRTNFGLGT